MNAGIDADQREIIGTIMNEANMLFDVVNDVLDFSKIEAGKLGLENIPFNPGDVLADVRCFLATSAQQKGLRFHLEFLEEDSWYVIGDPGRLRQILWNLGGNAVKFAEQEEICISVEMVEDQGDSVKFQFVVRDTGVGVPKEKQNAIFDSFNRLDGSTTRKYGGTQDWAQQSQSNWWSLWVAKSGLTVRLAAEAHSGLRWFSQNHPMALLDSKWAQCKQERSLS